MLSSLRSRMFLASALLAVLSIGVSIYLVNVRVTRTLEEQLQREIVSTRALTRGAPIGDVERLRDIRRGEPRSAMPD